MTTNTGGIAGEQLRSFIERIERLEEDRKGIAEDIKEIYAGAKATGFDPKIMRKVISIRKMDQADRQEQEALLDVYMHAIEGGERVMASSGLAASPVDDTDDNVVAINE